MSAHDIAAANAIAAVGAKRRVQSHRYKKSSNRKQLKISRLAPKSRRLRYKISSPCYMLSLWELISMMAGSTLQDDIVATAQELRRKGEDVLGGNVTFNL